MPVEVPYPVRIFRTLYLLYYQIGKWKTRLFHFDQTARGRYVMCSGAAMCYTVNITSNIRSHCDVTKLQHSYPGPLNTSPSHYLVDNLLLGVSLKSSLAKLNSMNLSITNIKSITKTAQMSNFILNDVLIQKLFLNRV